MVLVDAGHGRGRKPTSCRYQAATVQRLIDLARGPSPLGGSDERAAPPPLEAKRSPRKSASRQPHSCVRPDGGRSAPWSRPVRPLGPAGYPSPLNSGPPRARRHHSPVGSLVDLASQGVRLRRSRFPDHYPLMSAQAPLSLADTV